MVIIDISEKLYIKHEKSREYGHRFLQSEHHLHFQKKTYPNQYFHDKLKLLFWLQFQYLLDVHQKLDEYIFQVLIYFVSKMVPLSLSKS